MTQTPNMADSLLLQAKVFFHACSTPFGRSMIAGVVIFLALLACWSKIQRTKERQRQNRRRAAHEAKHTEEVVHRQLTASQTYLEGFAVPKPKVLLAAQVIFDDLDRKEMEVIEEVKDTLRKMCGNTEVYITMSWVDQTAHKPTDEEIKKRVILGLDRSGIIQAGFKTHRIVICSSIKGKAHVARHLMPNLYMDGDLEPLQMVAPHIKDTVMVSEEAPLTIDRVKHAKNITDFFQEKKVSPPQHMDVKGKLEVSSQGKAETQDTGLRRRHATMESKLVEK
uniref:Peroxisome biogenesis protein 22 n=1 Tax=Amorphochlora amoebiformis TaxID=1561963 RepID=A0A7S0DJF0_9EUKA